MDRPVFFIDRLAELLPGLRVGIPAGLALLLVYLFWESRRGIV